MKKSFKTLFAALAIICALPAGCVKDPEGSTMPNVSSFAIQSVGAWNAGAAATVFLMSSTLGSGEYTVHYDITGANMMRDLAAVVMMTGTSGSFQTPVLVNKGVTNVVITSITNVSGSTATLTSDNTYTFSDSTGLMTGTMAGAAYKATHVNATWPGAGGTLAINAIKWAPLCPVNLYVDNWNNAPVTIHFNSHNSTGFLGSASYSTPGNAHLSEYGTITISAVSPLLTGTFSFTSEDSSVVAGSFSCVHP